MCGIDVDFHDNDHDDFNNDQYLYDNGNSLINIALTIKLLGGNTIEMLFNMDSMDCKHSLFWQLRIVRDANNDAIMRHK